VIDSEQSDERLVAAARAGDTRALEALLARHQAEVYRFGMKMCRDPEDAKDVLQETLLAASRGVQDFRGASSLSTWLYTIARSHCLKKRRRSKSAPEVERSLETDASADVARLVAPGEAPDEALANQEVERALASAIADLEPMYREVLLLRDVEGLTAAQVAEVVGVSVQAVKSRLHRARLVLRERVGPLFGLSDAPGSSGCPDLPLMFSRHLEDEISAEQCAEMERHLQRCPRCRGACDVLKRTLAICRTAGVTVPVDVQTSVRTALQAFFAEKA